MPQDMNIGKWKTTGFLSADGYKTGNQMSGMVFDALLGFTRRKTMPMIEKVLQKLVTLAKGYTPVRTGALKDSITYFVVPEQMWGAFGSELPYAKFVNDGTSRMEGRHFLEAALDTYKMQNLGG